MRADVYDTCRRETSAKRGTEGLLYDGTDHQLMSRLANVASPDLLNTELPEAETKEKNLRHLAEVALRNVVRNDQDD